ncbi:MAG: hypothetical protein PHE96_12015 [Methylococcales bacterium]|nr:hypothetical protein [Methylococcales bacterium]
MNKNLVERLAFLQRVVTKEIKHLNYSSMQVFKEPLTIERVASLATDEDLAEKVEAFTSRFSRLQDTVGDKLLPTWLNALGEQTGAAIDNLDKAEKLGVLASADQWLEIRQLRNQMIHEYIEAIEVLTNALQAAHDYQQELINLAQAILNDVNNRNLIN